jgi:hypothetical protein
VHAYAQLQLSLPRQFDSIHTVTHSNSSSWGRSAVAVAAAAATAAASAIITAADLLYYCHIKSPKYAQAVQVRSK